MVMKLLLNLNIYFEDLNIKNKMLHLTFVTKIMKFAQ